MGGIASPNPMMVPPVMNPILAEIDAAHANLSPDAQAAIEKAHGIAAPAGIAAPNGPATEPPPGGGIQAPAPTTVGAGITPPGTATAGLYPTDLKGAGQTGQGTLGDALGGGDDNVSSAAIQPPAVPSLGSKMPVTPTPIGTGKVSPELARITAPDNHQHDKTNTGTPGVNQIHNPWARVPLQILDALGRGFFPGVEMGLPGTSGHHDVLVHQRQVEDTAEQNAAKAQTEEELQRAEAEHATAQAQAAGVKTTPKETGTVHEDSEGNYWVIHGDGSATQVAPNGKALQGKAKEETGGTVHEDRDGNMWVVKGDGTAVPVKPKSAGPATPAVAAPVTGEPTVATPTATAGAGVPGQLKGKSPAEKEGETPIGDERAASTSASLAAQYKEAGIPLPSYATLNGKHTQKDEARIVGLAKDEITAHRTNQEFKQRELDRQAQFAAANSARADSQLNHAWDKFNTDFKKELDPVQSQLENVQEARRLVNAGAEGQALGAVKTLVAVAGGKGTGVRITQAELNSIPSARSVGGDVQGFIQKLDTGKKMTPDQVNQLNTILGEVEALALEKQGRVNKYLDMGVAAKSPAEFRGIEQQYRHDQQQSNVSNSSGGGTDPAVKAYADKFFGGDLKKAQAAIDSQKKK